MFHLQDFLEKLELLTPEATGQLAKIGEMDFEVEQNMDIVKKSVDELFSKADHLNPDELSLQFNEIMKTGEKAVELSENKIQVANSLQKLMERYMKTLDIDLLKFQMNLDKKYGAVAADIEKRVLDSEESHMTIPKKNKYHMNNYVIGVGQQDDQSFNGESDEEINVENLNPACLNTNSPLKNNKMTNSNASQEEINSEKQSSSSRSSEIPINNETVVKSNRIKKSNTKQKKTEKEAQDTKLVVNKQNDSKKRYCICNEVAYDKMIACDHKSCPYEWFHFECVGISNQPHGRWYCNWCLKKMKKRCRK